MGANNANSVQMPQNAAPDEGLRCLLTEISVQNTVKMKTSTRTPKTRNGLVQMIKIDKSAYRKGSRFKILLKDFYSQGVCRKHTIHRCTMDYAVNLFQVAYHTWRHYRFLVRMFSLTSVLNNG